MILNFITDKIRPSLIRKKPWFIEGWIAALIAIWYQPAEGAVLKPFKRSITNVCLPPIKCCCAFVFWCCLLETCTRMTFLSLHLMFQIVTAVFYIYTDSILISQYLYYKIKNNSARSKPFPAYVLNYLSFALNCLMLLQHVIPNDTCNLLEMFVGICLCTWLQASCPHPQVSCLFGMIVCGTEWQWEERNRCSLVIFRKSLVSRCNTREAVDSAFFSGLVICRRCTRKKVTTVCENTTNLLWTCVVCDSWIKSYVPMKYFSLSLSLSLPNLILCVAQGRLY